MRKTRKKQSKNMNNKTLRICSTKPMTGYLRNGKCDYKSDDFGKHLVCAQMDKRFLDYSVSVGNPLRSVVKEGERWCICEDRYIEAKKSGKAPKVIENATNEYIQPKTKKMLKRNTPEQFLYNPDDPKKSFDVYIDKNPDDTIPIKYSTTQEVKSTIQTLETLYKDEKYTHKRIWQVAMIMRVRLGVILKYKKTRYPKAVFVKERYELANKYFNFLSQRTKARESERRKMVFRF